MRMNKTLAAINAMEADGIIGRYAIAGAIAAYNYVEAAFTEDIDILVSFDRSPDQASPTLIALAPVFSYLKSKGYTEHRSEGIVIEGWPVQFLSVANALDAEALAEAEEIVVEFSESEMSLRTRILRPEHLVATALLVGRPKDHVRVAQFLSESAVDLGALCDLLVRHGLTGVFQVFCERAGIANPCGIERPP